jgi:CubicO group peptidase (beta-lactamase class C family)
MFVRDFRRIFVPLVAALLLTVSFAATQAQTLDQKFDDYLKASLRLQHFNGAALVAKDGKVIFAKGYGMADAEHFIANGPDTKYLMGSVTKQFTAAAILQLAEKKKLNLNDPIGKYLPDYPRPAADKVTIHHLLTHTSGIPGFTELPEFRSIYTKPSTHDEIVATFEDLPLQFEPGSEWKYSNSGYFLLGMIIEKVSGQDYGDYLRSHIFEPLGMKNTGYPKGAMESPGLAIGYTSDSSGNTVRAVMTHSSIPFSAGALYSTVGDMVKWDAGLRNGRILTRESLDKMFTPYKEKYGYGWMVDTLYGHQLAMHGGGIEGFVCDFARFLDQPFCVMVFSNNQDASAEKVAMGLVAIANGQPYDVPVRKTPAAVDPNSLTDFVGAYQVSPEIFRTVMREGDSLFVQRTGGDRRRLHPEGKDKFYYENDNAITLTFVRDASGKVTDQVIHQNGRDQKCPRVEGEQADKLLAAQTAVAVDPAVYDKLAGDYELAPGFVLTIRRNGNSIMTQATGQSEVEIFPKSETEYFLKVVDAQISFVKDGNGAVTSLVLHQGGRDMPAKKIK